MTGCLLKSNHPNMTDRTEDIPYWIRCVRWMIRPTLTLFFSALWGWAYLGFCTPAEHQDKLMGAIVLMVNGFWFGEKLFNKTAVLDLLQRKPKVEK
jgi:hypothetical protein